MTALVVLAILGWLYLAVAHGSFWRPLTAALSPDPKAWPSVDIIVPARNEADTLPGTLPGLLAQNYPGTWRILLVDDHSSDGTRAVAEKLAAKANAANRLTVVQAPDLPKGWVGKVAAMQAGVEQSAADYILFTDADIAHPPHSLRRLTARAVERRLDLTSLMVRLHVRTEAEMLLIPAFVFFFAMLYPFRRVNTTSSRVAAAAGGAMLVLRQALNNMGGLRMIGSAVIDDCALAKAIKRAGGPQSTPGAIDLTMATDVKSLRVYPGIGDVWSMITRTAYRQLRYSPLLLAGTVVGMALLFVVPLVALLVANLYAAFVGLCAWVLMAVLYLPTILYYRLPPYWALTLPFAAIIYTAATIDSARLSLMGKGGQWKGRTTAAR
jgi:hopene-associated glycosyltransferase HpnB